ncbi:hypothetical protein IFM89_011909 [Coptis chinensis]|uniref:Cytochrome P450 n=1 Tax=Coptis chinensis TaxID=261450 RepID=A0A835I1P5_9MAGN|nr:hypothetical protein IFM89_011909 [Coptis chinensis]
MEAPPGVGRYKAYYLFLISAFILLFVLGFVKAVRDKNEMQRFQKALSQCLHVFGWSAAMEAFPFLQWINYGGYKGAMKSTARDVDYVFRSWVQEHRRRKLSADVGDHDDFIDVMISSLIGMEFPGYDHDTIIKAMLCGRIMSSVTEQTVQTVYKFLISIIVTVQSYLSTARKFVLHESMEDCTIGGYRIPSGTTVIVNLWKLPRDPQVWSDPLEFQPERFIMSHMDVEVLRGQDFELIPFGSGRRSCPGISFALQVLHLTLARLLFAFDLATPLNTPVDMTETVGATTSKASPLEVVLTPCLSSKLYE